MSEHEVIIIKFGNGCTTEIFKDRYHGRLERYERPENWKPIENYIYPKGTPCLDMREFFNTTRGATFAIHGPMVGYTASTTESKFPLSLQIVDVETYLYLARCQDKDNLIQWGEIEHDENGKAFIKWNKLPEQSTFEF